jgi:hypothetical protein
VNAVRKDKNGEYVGSTRCYGNKYLLRGCFATNSISMLPSYWEATKKLPKRK